MATAQDGSCDFANTEDPQLLRTPDDFTDDSAQTFLTDILDASGIKYLSPENYIIEITTFVLLNCDVDVMSQFHQLLLLLTTKRINIEFRPTAPLSSVWRLLKAINVAKFEILCTGCGSQTRCNCTTDVFCRSPTIIQKTNIHGATSIPLEEDEESEKTVNTPVKTLEVVSIPLGYVESEEINTENFTEEGSNIELQQQQEHSNFNIPGVHFTECRGYQDENSGRKDLPSSPIRRLINKFEAMSQYGGRPPEMC